MNKLKLKEDSWIKDIGVGLIFGAIAALYFLGGRNIYYDVIWLFHMMQKVAEGYTIYNDFNIVVSPFYIMVGSLFVKIFGNSIISMHIFSFLTFSALACLIYRMCKLASGEKNSILYCSSIFLYFIVAISLPNYNSFSLLFVFVAMYLEMRREMGNENKKKDLKYNVGIGIALALACFTKQNIGFFGVLATGAISIKKWIVNRKSTIKEILAKTLGFLIISLVFLVYFMYTKSFATFFDYCIGGIANFEEKNGYFIVPYGIIYSIVMIILSLTVSVIYEDKVLNLLCIYQMFIMFIIFPSPNVLHVVLSLMPMIVIIGNLRKYFCQSKIMQLWFLILKIAYFVALFKNIPRNPVDTFSSLMIGELTSVWIIVGATMIFIYAESIGILIRKEKLMSTLVFVTLFIAIFLLHENYKINVDNEYVSDNLTIYRNLGCTEEQLKHIEEVNNFILEKEKEGQEVCVVSADSSYYMAQLGRNNNRFDMPLYGNLGSRAGNVLVDDAKKLGDAILLKNKSPMWQETDELKEYIEENYVIVGEVGFMEIYEKVPVE